MKTNSNNPEIYDDINFGIAFAGFAAAAYGMYGHVNVPVIASGPEFISRKEKESKNPRLE
ncbi:MAG: hypothetical protein PHV16_05420 [Candidatus Nanoarchaeia archaeon]|nr:hypothetical protein [Candidatus Nanoarchaeia archaeon]